MSGSVHSSEPRFVSARHFVSSPKPTSAPHKPFPIPIHISSPATAHLPMEDSASGGVGRSGVIAPLDDLARDSPGPFALPPISTTVRMPGANARRASGDSGAGAGGGGTGTAGDNVDIKSDRRPSRTWAGAGTAGGEAESPQTLPPLAGRASGGAAVGPTSSKMPSDTPLSPTSPSVLLGRAVLGASGAHGGRSDRVSTCACWGRGGHLSFQLSTRCVPFCSIVFLPHAAALYLY